jgi:hypothetical protein
MLVEPPAHSSFIFQLKKDTFIKNFPKIAEKAKKSQGHCTEKRKFPLIINYKLFPQTISGSIKNERKEDKHFIRPPFRMFVHTI